MYEYIILDLQLFSEKTEEATSKKKQDTRKKGNVLQSKELTGAITLFVAVFTINMYSANILEVIVSSVKYYNGLFYELNFNDAMEIYNILIKALIFTLRAVVYIIIPTFITAFVIQRLQVGSLYTTEPLKPKLSRLNPIEGFKRMFSMQAVMNLIKSLLKIILVGYVGYVYIRDNIGLIMKAYELDKMRFSYMVFFFSINMALRMAFVIIILGFVDYFYQNYSYKKNIRMSKQEVKEEFKQTEGDPQIKAKIKERQRQAAMRRMMQELPKADVIITNPTHFAVALKYDEDKYDAPYVIAKGQDYIAKKIKEKAKEYEIPIIENKPLARTLYKEIEIGRVITPDLYEAVAEVLAYIYSIKENNRR
ncbi:flagellar biosynthetic protein FlhB [Peptoanaerobacter stomatis]|uniref:Flagellar biosynthetic protein FlhB n=1 Tax=Peptoanaerobacter stomatis TaxID=796937 RepID=J6H8R7_9FIRM|nr:flagellar biosynthesis protein FlhB [Peptoanaerobacter stomatis]EHL17272.2 flagellar biosynthetic protein FlhB [Peptoanaerobacter stomatis]EJU21590.1 flagellar biosynthetic protein FlhB [Peptoanaerobacter stomatis]NWO24755.1 flagellar biosynthesis protein FlhB [Peptostreptococcaceae bacterium oral taxon 081]